MRGFLVLAVPDVPCKKPDRGTFQGERLRFVGPRVSIITPSILACRVPDHESNACFFVKPVLACNSGRKNSFRQFVGGCVPCKKTYVSCFGSPVITFPFAVSYC